MNKSQAWAVKVAGVALRSDSCSQDANGLQPPRPGAILSRQAGAVKWPGLSLRSKTCSQDANALSATPAGQIVTEADRRGKLLTTAAWVCADESVQRELFIDDNRKTWTR